MTAMNIVHMRVKPGKEEEFLAIHRDFRTQEMPGSRRFSVVATGERMYCIVGEWDDMEALIAARPAMIGNLDRLRPILEDLGGGRGVTEPWSGTVALSVP
ncbi:MAG TPA: antibiotic biosynthesis monooxygenase family protein [Devosia sp.]